MQTLDKGTATSMITAAAHTTGDEIPLGGRRYGDPAPLNADAPESRTVIHTVTGMLRGSDMDITDALAYIDSADTVGWQPHIVGHDLIAIKDGQAVRFDVRQPD